MRERLAKRLLRVTLECTRERLVSKGENIPPITDADIEKHWNLHSQVFRGEALALADAAIDELSN